MSERETRRGNPEVGVCHVCGETFPTQEELSKHLIQAQEGLPSNDPRDGTRPLRHPPKTNAEV